jgi:hypothetical protein
MKSSAELVTSPHPDCLAVLVNRLAASVYETAWITNISSQASWLVSILGDQSQKSVFRPRKEEGTGGWNNVRRFISETLPLILKNVEMVAA